MLRGLALLHSQRIAHCDVKADNIMFSAAGVATLIDLGAACAFGLPVREGVPPDMALGENVDVASAAVDRISLAVSCWWAAHMEEPPAGITPEGLAELCTQRAAAAARGGEGGEEEAALLAAIAAILRATDTDAALSAVSALCE